MNRVYHWRPPRIVSPRVLRTVADTFVLVAAYGGAFLIRFDGIPPFLMIKRLAFTLPYVILLQLFALHVFSVPRFAWRHVSVREAKRVLWATGLAAGALLIVRLVTARLMAYWPHAEYALVPIGVIVADFVLAMLGVLGLRVLRRLYTERASTQSVRAPARKRIPTILIGAGRAGAVVAREISVRPDLAIHPVGFLDDDLSKVGQIVEGIKVLGTTEKLASFSRQLGVKQTLITIARAQGKELRRIVRICDQAHVTTKIIPGIFEILDGKTSVSLIRDVSIEDLLGREPVTLEVATIRRFLEGKRVLVSGAGGSIGSELCRQVSRFGPSELLLVERAEPALFSVHRELVQDHPHLEIKPLLCDVCDRERVEAIFSDEKPHVVFHAAAHKHVPMLEWNPGEAVKNNLFGTRGIADAADRHGSESFVLISTDKAVNPTSVMGATKRAAEAYVQSLSQRSSTKYVAVRFGNVLGSAGSVVPTFKEQIASGGPITITHPDMKRYFMTIPEASQLVMQAASMGDGGEIFLLDMGEPVAITSLAEELVRLSGLEPHVDIQFVFTGMRPGEKLFEELSFDAEKMRRTRHNKIFVGMLHPNQYSNVVSGLHAIQRAVESGDPDAVRRSLKQHLVPEMQESVPPPLGPSKEERGLVEERPRLRPAPA